METEKPKKPGEDKVQAKPQMQPVPTQKTFIFKGSAKPQEIDGIINTWMKQMTLRGEMPHLGKITTHKSFFRSKIIYVFMHSVFVEVPMKKI